MAEDGKKIGIHGEGLEAQDNELPVQPLKRIAALLDEKRVLTDKMLRATHKLVTQAFKWQKDQNLKWVQYFEVLHRQLTEHRSYFYTVDDNGKNLLLEVFEPQFIDHARQASVPPQHLCIVEYDPKTKDIVELDKKDIIGSSMYAQHGSRDMSESFDKALGKNALAIASWEKESPVFERMGKLFVNMGCDSFGWTSSTTSFRYSTNIPLRTILQSTTSGEVGCVIRGDSDPIEEGQRRLELLSRAKLVVMSKPPERTIVPYPQS